MVKVAGTNVKCDVLTVAGCLYALSCAFVRLQLEQGSPTWCPRAPGRLQGPSIMLVARGPVLKIALKDDEYHHVD